MIKTEFEVVSDILRMIKADPLGQAVEGRVYRDQTRPYNSQTTDIVLHFLSGRDDQIQTGLVVMNIYVPDIRLPQGQMTRDFRKIEQLQKEVLNFIDRSRGYDYRLTTDTSMTTLEQSDIRQHFINARLRFQRLSE